MNICKAYINDEMKDLRNILNHLEYRQLGDEFSAKYLSQNIAENLELIAQNKKKVFGGEWSYHLKPKLLSLLENRCSICERKISHPDSNAAVIEHFRPKTHYWWLAYDFTNYTLACSTCNLAKGEAFPLHEPEKQVDYHTKHEIVNEKPLLINPFLEEPYKYFKLVFVNYSGSRKYNVTKLVVNPSLTDGYETQKAKKTIEIYNLDLHKKEEDGRYHKDQIIAFEELCKEILPFAQELQKRQEKLKEIFKLKKTEPNKYKDSFQVAEKEFKTYINYLKNIDNQEITQTGYWQLLLQGQYQIGVIPTL